MKHNYIFAYDFCPPKPTEEAKNILLLHTAKMDLCHPTFSRLMDLYPNATFYLIKNENVQFPEFKSKQPVFINHNSDKAPADPSQLKWEQSLDNLTFDLAFFCVNMSIPNQIEIVDHVPLNKNYAHVFALLRALGCDKQTHLVDFCYKMIAWEKIKMKKEESRI